MVNGTLKDQRILAGIIVGVSFIAFVVLITLIGNESVINSINTGLAGIYNSGWPLASLFATSGIVPLVLSAAVIILVLGMMLGGKLFMDSDFELRKK